jgi:two-component system phosphate regulon sensor histidine kinase PhoR
MEVGDKPHHATVMTSPIPAGAVAAMEMAPGGMSQSAADRLAALTVRAAGAACAMIHLVDGRLLRLIGGDDLPPGFEPMQQVPMSSTLAGLVLKTGFPIVITDVNADARVPGDAPVRSVGLRSYAGFPVRDPGGDIVGVCAVMDYRPRDWLPEELTAVDDGAQACTAFVAEQRAREAEQQQRLFLDTLLNSLDTGVAACDADGRMVLVNRSLRGRLGVETVQGTAEDWVTRLPITEADGAPVIANQAPLLRALRQEEVRAVEQVLHARGGQRLFRVNGHPITGSGGQRLGAVSVFHDITEARRAEELQQLLSRSKDEYLTLVGHELRTPVTIIGSYLELMNDSHPDMPVADLLPLIAAAQRGSERLRCLVEALLDLSALDAGRTVLEMVDIDLISVVAGALRDIETRATAKKVAISQDVPARMPMHGNPQRLAQLVAALLDNAIAYTPDGGAVTVRIRGTDTTVKIEVSDTGLGIPEHERPKVFERFFRGAIATELSIPGAGLGLAIAHLIAERHHGTITAGPNDQMPGTKIRVNLPR